MTSHFLLKFPVLPVPASRPRFTRFGKPYYGKGYTKFRKESARQIGSELFKLTLDRFDLSFPLLSRLRVMAVFYVPRPETTKREWPRGDVDNYLKTLDVFNGILWRDDDQITMLTGRKEWGQPHIELTVEYDRKNEQICQARALPKVRLSG